MSATATRALSTGLKAKLAALLRLPASDHDGERANAAAAIGRVLHKNNRDIHDLVGVLLAEPIKAAPKPNATTWKRSTGAIDLSRGELLDLLDMVEERSPFLPIRSAEFIDSLRGRSFRPMVHMSEKQWAWLQDLIQGTGV